MRCNVTVCFLKARSAAIFCTSLDNDILSYNCRPEMRNQNQVIASVSLLVYCDFARC